MLIVVPENDSHPHELEDSSCSCGCSIVIVEETSDMILVHNQFDENIKTMWILMYDK